MAKAPLQHRPSQHTIARRARDPMAAVRGGKSETVNAPSQVIVSRRNNPKSDTYGNVSRVRVVGGNRWIPDWNKSDHMYDQNPSRVDVLLSDGALRTYTDAAYVTVRGGDVVYTDYVGGDDLLTSLLPGPTMIGFWGLFDGDYGDPGTPRPYACVKPSENPDGAALPFRCPNCPRVISPREAGKRMDLGRNHHWCPGCDKRYCLVLPAGRLKRAQPTSRVAPSAVSRGSGVEVVDKPTVIGELFRSLSESFCSGIDVLGACL